jgi:Zn-dependent membrane protease YugP
MQMTLYLISIAMVVISLIVQARFRSKSKKYTESGLSNGLSGAEIARKMLRDNRITDVEVTHTPGQLTDHYNPATKTVNLSDEVYHGRSTLAAAVAAHECGHAVQHATAYSWLEFRSAMVGPVSIASRYMTWLILGGLILSYMGIGTTLLMIGVVLFSLTTAFTFITLPVEFDASKRALAWLSSTGMVQGNEEAEAKDALKWAAMTYVMAALSSLATLLYYISLFTGRDE